MISCLLLDSWGQVEPEVKWEPAHYEASRTCCVTLGPSRSLSGPLLPSSAMGLVDNLPSYLSD